MPRNNKRKNKNNRRNNNNSNNNKSNSNNNNSKKNSNDNNSNIVLEKTDGDDGTDPNSTNLSPDATAKSTSTTVFSEEEEEEDDQELNHDERNDSSLMSCFPIAKHKSNNNHKLVESTTTTTTTTTIVNQVTQQQQQQQQQQNENVKVTLVVKTVKLENEGEQQIDKNNNTSSTVDSSGDKKNIIIKNVLISDVQQQYDNYRVDSPELVAPRKNDHAKLGAQIKKSRSLDDNEITIHELSANSSAASIGGNDSNQPIISEASDSETSRSDGVFSPPISEEEEQNLRGFLRTLNIDDYGNEITTSTPPQSPTEDKPPDLGIPTVQVPSQSNNNQANDIKARRARKRAEIESHFLPLLANPRYLDIIKEESSDTSDIERKSDKAENDYDYDFDPDDDVFIDKLKIVQKSSAVFPKQAQIQRHIVRKPTTPTDVIREEPQLMIVDTKLLEPIDFIEESCTTNWRKETVESPIEASVEMIYLDSASDTNSNSDVMDLDYTADVDDELSESDVRIETPVIGETSDTLNQTKSDNSDIDSFSRETTPDANHFNQNHSNANNTNSSSSSASLVLNRQDSVDSVCSSNNSQTTTRYVETSYTTELDSISDFDQMKTLRELCVEHLAEKPYGGAVLEELATVSESLSTLTSDKEKKLRVEMMTPPPPAPPVRNLREKSQTPPPVPSPPPPPIPERPSEFFSTVTSSSLPQIHTTTAQVNLRTADNDDRHPNIQKIAEQIEKIENVSLISPSSELNTKTNSSTATTTTTASETSTKMYDLISESPPLPQIPTPTSTMKTTLTSVEDDIIDAADTKNRLLAILRQSSIDNNSNSENKCESSMKSVQSTSFETKKVIENGNIVYESSDKNRKVLKNVDGQIIENVNETETSENKNNKSDTYRPSSAFTSIPHNASDKLPKNKLFNETDNNFIFKEFDFVPSAKKPFADNGIRDSMENGDKFKSKSHHDFFFNKHFDELNAEFKRKFESNLMRSTVIPTRPVSMQDQMRLNCESFDDWLKHARQTTTNTAATTTTAAATNQSTENIMKPILREDNFVKNGRSASNIDIRAPRISAQSQTNREQNKERDEVIQRQYNISQNHNYQTRQSMIDETPITQTLGSSTLPKRRLSLPKELHERQLNMIRQKENELKAEFERLEAERRKLEMEMFEWSENIDENLNFENNADEFRRKMRNEWLDKVAEREERRMQKIVKISKPYEEVTVTDNSGRNDLGNEFLSRVKERRSKLNMPSDSDWESGAESQPNESAGYGSEKPKEHIIKVKLVEGEEVVDDRKKIPKHLQEFLDLTSESIQSKQQTKETEAMASSHPKTAPNEKLIKIEIEGKQTSSSSTAATSTKKTTSGERHDDDDDEVHADDNGIKLKQNQRPPLQLRRPQQQQQQITKKPFVREYAQITRRKYQKNEKFVRPKKSLKTDDSFDTFDEKKYRRRSLSENDLLYEIDKGLSELARGFLFGHGIWSPNSKSTDNLKFQDTTQIGKENYIPEPPPPPVWTPGPSPTFGRKEFRPVNFESPTFQRKLYTRQDSDTAIQPPWDSKFNPQTQNIQTTTTSRIQSSQSASNISSFGRSTSPSNSSSIWSTRNVNLPKFQNPTVTLLQKAREEQQQQQQQNRQYQQQQQQQKQQQAQNIQQQYYQDYNRNYQNQHSVPAFMQRDKPNEIIHTVRRNYVSESELIDSNDQSTNKMTTKSSTIERNNNNINDVSSIDRHLAKENKFIEGIGPTTKDGMPIVLRSEVNEHNQSKWYKKMYNTLHKTKDDDDYVTVRYKTRRGRYPYKTSGYMSEPEPSYDSDYSIKYSTLDRRRTPINGSHSYYEKSYGTLPNPIKTGAGQYKNQPGRIENYVPGHSSISEKETKQWLDENSSLPYFSIVFAREVQKFHLEQQKHVPSQFTQGNLSRALKHEGYESDSSLVFKREQSNNFAPLSPVEQKIMYRSMQVGGDPPLQGFRKPAPEKPKDEFDEIEYYPITSTLTKIRVNKKSNTNLNNQNEIICYPITSLTKPIDLFGSYSTTAHSFVPITPPPPPNRRSSKRNTILKMFSETKIKTLPTNTAKRHHETCYESNEMPMSTSIMKRSNTSESLRSKSSGPIMSTSTRRTASLKEEKNLENNTTRHIARRQYLRVCSASPVNRSRLALDRKSSPSPVAFGRGISKERTFAEEKKRLEQARQDLVAPCRILRNPALKSPDEVKRALQSTFKLPARSDRNVCIRASRQSSMSASTNRKSGETTIRVQMSHSVPAAPTRSSRLSKTDRNSTSTLSLARTNSTYSIDSIQPKSVKKSKPLQPQSPLTVSGKSKPRKKITASKEKLEVKKRGGLKKGNMDNQIVVAKNTMSSIQKRDQYDNKEIMHSINEAIVQHKDRGDNFFQNLFLRNLPSPTPSTASSYYRNTSVMEKARMWNSLNHELKPPQPQPQQTIYLSNKKPVSRSKFKIMEEERLIVPRMSRSLSPTKHLSKYDSIYHFSSENEDEFELEDEFGNNVTKSLTYSYHERSRSEPQSKSTTIMTEIRRPNSPVFIHGRSNSSSIEYRSISPARSHVRSPSCRRIHSFRSNNNNHQQQSATSAELVQQRKVSRARSVGSADSSYHNMSSTSNLMRSSCSLSNLNYEKHNPLSCYHHNHPHSHRKSERFRELNEFYSNLERLGQLERATSTSDVRPIRSDEEVIDFDLWKKIRDHQKAEKELTYLVQKLKEKQKDKDFLFKPHDVDEIKWDRDRDSGLRTKEKSVEDLREVFHRKADDSLEIDEDVKQKLDTEKGTYKLLYRGSSVLDLASNMVEKYNGPRKLEKIKPPKPYKFPLSNKLISTLSKDQISKIKHQLSEIYSNGPHSTNCNKSEKYEEISEKYIITVPPPVPPSLDPSKFEKPTGLTVRSSSLMSRDELLSPKLQKRREMMEKSESISSINHKPQIKSTAAPSNASAAQLSESEKRKISLNLCREIKDKISQRRQERIELLPKETRGAYAAEMSAIIPKPPPPARVRSQSEENYTSSMVKVEPTTYTSTINRRTKAKSMAQRPISFCGTDTLNSHEFGQISRDDVRSKIKYFEEKKTDEEKKGTTIYHAREDSSPDEEEIIKLIEQKFKLKRETESKPETVVDKVEKQHVQSTSLGIQSSSSVTDLQEMFGEKKPQPSRTISNSSSCESLVYHHHRSRSASPKLNSLTHERSYINVIRAGDVRKIKDKFESLDSNVLNSEYWSTENQVECNQQHQQEQVEHQSPQLTRRYRSDPELDQFDFFEKRDTSAKQQKNATTIKDHEAGDVSRITHKFEIRNSINQNRSLNRSRKRTREIRVTSPIPKIALKKDDRFMPHIDIISKTAALKQEIKKPIVSASWPTRAAGSNEIERIKTKFENQEKLSILGQMYTSTPDFRELKDISSYLTGPWVAHKFPKPQDNAITFETNNKSNELVVHKRPSSTSPPRRATPNSKALITSILKPYYDIFANQKYDPLIHRPKYRYVPGQEAEAEHLWRKLQHNINKLSVKFEGESEVVVPPPPPLKGIPLHSYQNNQHEQESPRRYIEGDVNIHYRTPIRQEFKEAIPEDELMHRQAEAMRRLYQEEKRRKYLQELQDINSRRHMDNFTPTQKSPIALNRYDSFPADLSPQSPKSTQQYTMVAKALYNFQGQSARELSFKKGDIIYIRRQIDKNWYDGEHNAMFGLFPANYVEIITRDQPRQPQIATLPKKPSEGQARAKYNFNAQSAIELSLNKGEIVTLTRRVDDNWFEGRIANRKGIFPVSYIDVLMEIGAHDQPSKPIGAPAAHSLITPTTPPGNAAGDRLAAFFTNGNVMNGDEIVQRETKTKQNTEVLHVDTTSEPITYRALYKYRPQNNDELELNEGDLIFVLEKCDDGWFVGTSQRTGYFGTFPGNYVEKL